MAGEGGPVAAHQSRDTQGRHPFRAAAIADYLTNGGRTEEVQHMGGHSNAKTTRCYDRLGVTS